MTLREFLFPKLDRHLTLRILVIVLVAYIVFGFVLLPIKVQGISMTKMPTAPTAIPAITWRIHVLDTQRTTFSRS